MTNIIERLRQHALPDPHDEREVMHAPLLKEAADLIESLQARVKELEAWRDSWVKCPEGAAAKRIKELEAKCDYWRDHYKALLQKIEDAPVVGYGDCLGQVRTENELDQLRALGDQRFRTYDRPLIRKEDLK